MLCLQALNSEITTGCGRLKYGAVRVNSRELTPVSATTQMKHTHTHTHTHTHGHAQSHKWDWVVVLIMGILHLSIQMSYTKGVSLFVVLVAGHWP